MQTHTESHLSSVAHHSSFVISSSEKLPLVQTSIVPVNHALYSAYLTPREAEVLELLGQGLSMKGAARGLGISPGTVKWHVKNVYWKLGASSREDALCKARQQQLI